jgi:hypothetical protein
MVSIGARELVKTQCIVKKRVVVDANPPGRFCPYIKCADTVKPQNECIPGRIYDASSAARNPNGAI